MAEYPQDVLVRDLMPYPDDRGAVMELFASTWDLPFSAAQWNAVRNRPGTLRGVHVHYDHDDYLTVPMGNARIGLVDLRRDSATSGLATVLEVGEDSPRAIFIPPGVGHGFYFPEAAVHVYAMSTPWDPGDDDGCRWDDPDLGLEWEVAGTPTLSERDANAGSLDELIAKVRSKGL